MRRRTPGPLVSGLLFVTLAELFLMGSGRLIQFGPLTLRMCLYLACLLCGLLLVLSHGGVDRQLLLLTLGFVGLTAGSAALGLLNHASLDQVIYDVKPLLFFLTLFFFASAITTVDQVRRVATLIRVCSVLLAVGYLIVLVLITARIIPFQLVYEMLSGTGEFFFRGQSGLFYKGFIYLGVGCCFFLAGERRSMAIAALLLLAIVLTFTRGLLLATILCAGIAVLADEGRSLRLPLYAVLTIGSLVAAWPRLTELFASRAESDAIRLFDVKVVERSATWSSVMIGHGLGSSVGDRARIEASYLQILHQQGILGLLFWLAVGAMLTRDCWRSIRRGWKGLALPYYLASLLVFFESVTNPFLTNNPIGMAMVLVSLVVLRLLSATPSPSPDTA